MDTFCTHSKSKTAAAGVNTPINRTHTHTVLLGCTLKDRYTHRDTDREPSNVNTNLQTFLVQV